MRGGGWGVNFDFIFRAANRGRNGPAFRGNLIGFRCVALR
ncbi:MAG: hypothetical protein GW893_12455 [Armatimonadetes bacterium]|nr:hypothetical protein [Armatimonadota bacterium]